MTHNKSLMIPLLACIMFYSCSSEKFEVLSDTQLEITEDAGPYVEFSRILSNAVCNDTALRLFLKAEAEKQFDCDYDIFYPWTKDKLVDGKRSFHEILAEYDYESKLNDIVNRIPQLTILIPDWSWVGDMCFSIKTWDAANQLPAVGFDTSTGDHAVFYKGMFEGVAPAGCFIDTPILIVKSNERMIAKAETKSGEKEYDFLDDSFKNTEIIVTKDHDEYYEYTIGTSNTSTWFSKMAVGNAVANCYSVFENMPSAAQRDYIYYGMTPTVSSGYINHQMEEQLFRFRIEHANYNSDDVYFESGDVSFVSHHYTGTNAPLLSVDELRTMTWGEGDLEFRFEVNAGFASTLCKFVDCSFAEAFVVTKVKERRRFNWLRALKSRLYYIERDCLGSKWINAYQSLFTWDIAIIPESYTITIYEHDNGASTTTSFNSTWSFMLNYDVNNELGGEFSGLTMKTSYGFSPNVSYSQTRSTSTTVVDGDDLLGTVVVQYMHPVVLQEVMAGVKCKSYSTGKVELIVLPKINN